MKFANIKYIGIDDTRIILAGIPFVGFIITLSTSPISPFETPGLYAVQLLVALSYTAFYWFTNRQIIIFFRQKYYEPEHTLKRLLLQTTVVVSYTYVACLLTGWIPEYFNLALPEMNGSMQKKITVSSIMATVTISAVYEIIFVVYRWNQTRVEAEALKKENLQSQLESLKSQVNPHFLFNSLNTLVAIIPENPSLAVDFVQNLSKVYRYVLEFREKELITLGEELAFIRSYIFLLNIRFPQNLTVAIEIEDSGLQQKIMPLVLQLLVENAIKHNIISQKQPLNIVIKLQADKSISVSNNLQLRSNPEPGTGLGLSNINNRYKMLSGSEIEIRNDGKEFEVKLPLL